MHMCGVRARGYLKSYVNNNSNGFIFACDDHNHISLVQLQTGNADPIYVKLFVDADVNS